MKNNILFLALSLPLMTFNTLLHGMEHDQNTIRQELSTLFAEANNEWYQGNYKKHDELMLKAEDKHRALMNAQLPKGIHWIQPFNGHEHISVSSETKDTFGFFTTPSFGSLTTVLYVTYDNKDRYAAIATSPMLGCTATDNEKTFQQDSIQESCKHVLQKQNETKKIITANFFLIKHKTHTAHTDGPNRKFFDAKEEKYASKTKSILEKELKNIAQIRSVDYYSHLNPEDLRNLALMVTSDKAYLRIGNIEFTDL